MVLNRVIIHQTQTIVPIQDLTVNTIRQAETIALTTAPTHQVEAQEVWVAPEEVVHLVVHEVAEDDSNHIKTS